MLTPNKVLGYNGLWDRYAWDHINQSENREKTKKKYVTRQNGALLRIDLNMKPKTDRF